MEPILRNIEKNPLIEPVESNNIQYTWPKSLGFADDLNILIKNKDLGVKEVFREYQKFSESSGLILNADKTEILQLGRNEQLTYSIEYFEQEVILRTKDEINVNGVIFNSNQTKMLALNFENILTKLNSQFQSWSNRNLSLLGKILIYKTYGLSQILYKASCIEMNVNQHKKIRDTIYKFIWNKNFDGNKAPDRIKRSFLCSNIENGGFGMVDHEDVCRAIKSKQAYRFKNKMIDHPIGVLLSKSYEIGYFAVKTKIDILPDFSKGLQNIQSLTMQYIQETPEEILKSDRILLHNIGQEKCKNFIMERYKNGIEYNFLRPKLETKTVEILQNENTKKLLKRIVSYDIKKLLEVVTLNYNPDDSTQNHQIPGKNGRYYSYSKITSKWIRSQNSDNSKPIIPRHLEINEQELKGIYGKIRNLTNIKHREILLRVIHGDIYSKERLMKFGMIDNYNCQRCEQRETIHHMFYECEYVKKIWELVGTLTGQEIRGLDDIFVVSMDLLALNSEIIKRLQNINRPQIPPNTFVKGILEYLRMVDFKGKEYFNEIFNKMES